MATLGDDRQPRADPQRVPSARQGTNVAPSVASRRVSRVSDPARSAAAASAFGDGDATPTESNELVSTPRSNTKTTPGEQGEAHSAQGDSDSAQSNTNAPTTGNTPAVIHDQPGAITAATSPASQPPQTIGGAQTDTPLPQQVDGTTNRDRKSSLDTLTGKVSTLISTIIAKLNPQGAQTNSTPGVEQAPQAPPAPAPIPPRTEETKITITKEPLTKGKARKNKHKHPKISGPAAGGILLIGTSDPAASHLTTASVAPLNPGDPNPGGPTTTSTRRPPREPRGSSPSPSDPSPEKPRPFGSAPNNGVSFLWWRPKKGGRKRRFTLLSYKSRRYDE
ncbi:hypothetical protein CC86DRAFT_380210 [Ophiobolus disseminans]|uniref:Uncharacterized protein n=1 Tax=Ophiobolus disseminans TaxID=1469910 RepID=A0A6A7AA30_9PLEO|nr:hypothetical protein CC86DRAFT_380210 [Ophiobolus disseminans]